MNAHQRRRAFRKIKSMVGRAIEITLKTGVVRKGIVVGLTKPVIELHSATNAYAFDGKRPSVHRVKVKLESKATMSPRLNTLRFA